MFEETGMTVSNLKYLGLVREWQGEYTFVHFVFLCRKFSGQPEVKEPHKCDGWQWFPTSNLKKVMLSHKAGINLYLKKLPIIELNTSRLNKI